ncbi:sigma-70 family RNA polymerase sigma factor [Ktedonosporobacter rubrisoli]|uniref:Sigma-70 family RNA polymerase sigma factor n=1 Tax=Ktedonosporobacter rubrisoli TaxID=2509675 RepID=A0A4V0YZQ1_KTERU|nr:sigma-70 family RNA polymerase sigma factor [Ktedonosporobacter rubrisoli]QBD80501.1 sigma-70 family RNA polymerase sigma factor [Ktedonosporobacter rubrisoli]
MQLPRSGSIRDDTALAELYQRHVYTLLGSIRRCAPTPEDAEDILLEVFMAAFEHNALTGWSEGKQLAWLRKVAHNKCVDIYRASQRRPSLSLETITEALYDDEDLLPEQMALHAEERALLHAHLTRLPEQQQQILGLRFGHGLRSREIARKLNKSESTIRMTLSRTLNLLRRNYSTEEDSDA